MAHEFTIDIFIDCKGVGNMGKVFVSGAAGNVGGAAAASLCAAGVEVVAGVRAEGRGDALKAMGAEVRPFDFADPDSMVAAMAGCDRVFLALPLVEGMTRLGHLAVEAMKAAGVEYVVRSSGYAASSDAHWRLGREHGMVDQFVEDSGIAFTTLRPNTFMQNFSTVMAPMVKGGTLTLPEKDAAVSYIDVRDVGDCAARLFQDNAGFENGFYALTGPEGLTLSDVAATLSELDGVSVEYQPVEEAAYVAGLLEMGTPKWNVDMLVSLTRVVKLGMMGNVTRAVEHVSGKPARTFAEFAREHASAWAE